MKHFPLKFAMAVAMLLSFLPASAYDFEANGLYFNITDATKHEVQVTYQTQYVGQYSGNINIPSTVTKDGTTYSVTSIGDYAFYGCSGLTSITIPNSVTSIGEGAFSWCTGLTSITIPNSVTSIGEGAFSWCTGLTSITIPSSVTSIGKKAFSSCKGLTSITIPNSVISIGYGPFANCSGLIEINVDSGNKSYVSIDGVLFNKNITNIIQYPAGKPGTTFSIPNSVASVGDYAFWSCSGLTSVTIPNSVTSIGSCAFADCTGLTSVTIPNSVTSIGSRTFYGCSSLTSVTIPNSVTAIEFYAFDKCPIKSVYCHWGKPLSINHSVFSDSCYEEGTLYVPKGCADKYRVTSPWSNFLNIEESDNLGIEDILANQPTGDYIVYDLQGTLRLKTEKIDEVKRLPAGLYIVNGKKTLIR